MIDINPPQENAGHFSSLQARLKGDWVFPAPKNRGGGSMEDSYIFDSPCALIDETDTWSSPDDSVQEYLETQDEPVEPPLEVCSEMSPARKLWYALSSLALWRRKAQVKQEKIRILEQRIRDLTESRANWREKANQAERQLKIHTISADPAAQTKPESSLKQTIVSHRE